MTPHLVPPVTPLTLREAAEHAGVSVSTIRRRKQALLDAGATITPTGWAIPITALNTVFVTPHERAHDTPAATPVDTPIVTQLRSENEFLRQQVEQQARTIERQAEAHAIISAQLTRLGQLEAATPNRAAQNESPTTTRRRWWQR